MGLKSVLPFLGMVVAELAQVGLIILSKQVMSNGMPNLIFIFYSNALASIFLLLASFLVHRSDRPPLTFSLLCGFFSLGVIGFLVQLTGYAGINYTSASFASAMLNLIPAFTFVLAIIFRMEKFECRSSSTLAKSIGTIVSIAGAFIMTLYKGPLILASLSHSSFPHQHLTTQASNWVIGGLFLVVDCILSSAYTIVQALILKNYPAELIMVFFYCFFVAILSAVFSLIVERDLIAWSLRPNIKLFSVLYSGIFGSAFYLGLITWCLHRTGPLFVAMFHPLGTVIAAAFGVAFLNDPFYLGSLVGSIVIVIGFYSVIWGKSKEDKAAVEDSGVESLQSTNIKTPFLENDVEETQVSVEQAKLEGPFLIIKDE